MPTVSAYFRDAAQTDQVSLPCLPCRLPGGGLKKRGTPNEEACPRCAGAVARMAKRKCALPPMPASTGLRRADPENACCGRERLLRAGDGVVRGTLGRNAAPGEATGRVEQLSTCLALIEMVRLVQSRVSDLLRGFASRIAGRRGAARGLAAAHSGRDRPQGRDRDSSTQRRRADTASAILRELLAWCHANPSIDYVLLNTNGVRLATDDAFPRCAREDLPLREVPALSAIRRRTGGWPARPARRRSARRAAAGDRALRRTEHPDHARHDGDPGEHGARLGRRRIRSPVSSCPRGGFSTHVQLGPDLASSFWFLVLCGEISSNRRHAIACLNTADVILAAVGQAASRLRL